MSETAMESGNKELHDLSYFFGVDADSGSDDYVVQSKWQQTGYSNFPFGYSAIDCGCNV